MCNLKSLVVVGLLYFAFGGNSIAQISKEQAIDSILTHLVAQDSLNYNAYLYPNLSYNDDFYLSPYDSLGNPYDSAWLFFIDLMPEYGWSHPCKYAFIQKSTGNYSVINSSIPPLFYWLGWEEISVPFPHQILIQSTDTILHVSSNLISDPHKFALLISWNAWEDLARWNDLSHVYTALKNTYGFKDENIFVLSGDGNFNPLTMNLNLDGIDNVNDFDGPCTKDEIGDIFTYLETKMTGKDLFLFYATTHGDIDIGGPGTTSLRLYNYQPLYDNELAEMVDNLTCSQMVFSIDACNAGGIADDLEGDHRVVQVPVPRGVPTMRIWDDFDFFTYGWATAVRGYHPFSKVLPWENGPKVGSHPDLKLVYPEWDKPDIMPDLVSFQGNGDGFIQFGEVFNYAKYLDGQTMVWGIQYQNHGFVGDLLTLNGIEGRVDESQNIVGNYLFGRKLTLSPGVVLSKGSSVLGFYLNDSTEILIDNGATLNIFGYTTEITGCTGESFVNVYGDLHNNLMNFTTTNDAIININFVNANKDYNFSQYDFDNTRIKGNCKSLSFTNSTFTNSPIKFSNGDLIVSNSNVFTNSTIDISNPSSLTSSCVISLNTFDNDATVQAGSVITIEGYSKFLIESNQISYDANKGIELFYAGWNMQGNHAIRNNKPIQFTGTAYPQFAELGIHSYFSNALIENNHIKNNDYGITGFHGSALTVTGNQRASDNKSTQLIEDNTISQCIFSYGSFPYEFHYNVLKDLSPGNKPFIKAVNYDEILPDTNENRGLRESCYFHVENNCWKEDSDPSDRLLPLNAYCWPNIWCPGGGHMKSDDIPGSLYYQAMDSIEEGNYLDAETGFKQIIAEYPENEYAQASLKGLFGLNPAIHDTDFTFVKAYCDSLSMNPGDSLLGKTAEWLSIHCNIRDKQYQLAVNSLDSIITNSGTLADSVFAMIDLGYVFNEINDSSGSKSALITKHPDIIPESNMKYVIQRKEWIELLLESEDNSTQAGITLFELKEALKSGRISSIRPNPSTGNFTIDYTLNSKGLVSLSILSPSGQTLAVLQKGLMEKGEYHEMISDLDLPMGIYFIKFSLDEVITDAGKLIIVK